MSRNIGYLCTYTKVKHAVVQARIQENLVVLGILPLKVSVRTVGIFDQERRTVGGLSNEEDLHPSSDVKYDTIA